MNIITPVQSIAPVHLLDNGHGGLIDNIYQTAGKRSIKWKNGTQLFEGDYNRKVVAKIAMFCDLFGVKYHVLVPELQDISLSQRVKRANAIHAEEKKNDGACVYWSIHANGFTNQDAHGFEVYTYLGQSPSDTFADILIEEQKKYFPNQKFRSDYSDGDADKESRFYVLKNTNMWAVLSENGFMTNFNTCQLMLQDWWITRVALSHFRAMQRVDNLLYWHYDKL